MAIAFVNGASNTSLVNGVTTITVTYTPTTGNRVVVGMAFGSSAQATCTVADNNGNALTSRGGATTVSSWIFEGIAVAGATSYKATFTSGVGVIMTLAEYSGVGGVGQTGLSNTGTNTAATLSATLSSASNWLIAEVNNIVTGTVTAGNVSTHVRESGSINPSGNPTSGGLGDTTGATSATVAFTVTSNTWHTRGFEYLPVAPILPSLFQYGWGQG